MLYYNRCKNKEETNKVYQMYSTGHELNSKYLRITVVGGGKRFLGVGQWQQDTGMWQKFRLSIRILREKYDNIPSTQINNPQNK